MLNNKFHVIIPARMHSTRLPHKMTLDLGGVPLIVRTARQALKSKASKVVVATDHPNIFQICQEHNLDVVMTKDTHMSGTDRLMEASEILQLKADEIVINVQGDEPLIEPELINELALFIRQQKTTMATIAHTIALEDEIFNPNIVKVVLDKNQNALYFSRASIPFYRDGFPPQHQFKLPSETAILRHIGIYAYSVEFLNSYTKLKPSPLEIIEGLEQLRVLYNGHKIAVLTTNKSPGRGIDTLEDLMYVRQLINSHKDQN
jgi:3-deoxy-manno-octulosonate cytidylyltransferase (CMP-KDO synthetase)